MRNIKITIEYDGTNYCGWQIQKSSKVKAQSSKASIQETIEKAIKKITHQQVRLIGSGRTDAGVHALAQATNFKTDSTISPDKLQRALNGLLPRDISIVKAQEADLDFHSRFSAKSKEYRYTILNRKFRSGLLKDKAYFFPYPLDVNLMRQEARCLLGRRDFKSFQTSDKKDRTSVRTIRKIKIAKERDLIYINIEADGFLYNMARSIVGTLLEIGRGKFPKGSLKKILLCRDRRKAGPTAPACGLCLVKVSF